MALLGTNKLASVVGTGSAAVTYAREVPVQPRTTLPMAAAAFGGSACGALLASAVPGAALKPVVLGALVVVLVVTWSRPAAGDVDVHRLSRRTARLVTLLGGAGIGLYDGMVGPGTGTFLVFLLVSLVGLSFLRAAATAKVVNTATNLAALLLFAAGGHVLWLLGGGMAVCNLLGAQVGARLAVRRGSAWVRRVFLVVVVALAARLTWDVLA